MNKFCKVIFDQYDQKIIVDFLIDENKMLKANTSFDPEIKDGSIPVGPAAMLCTSFLEALYSKTDVKQPDTNEPTTESES